MNADKLTIKITDVTPDQAASWRQKNPANRRLRSAQINAFVRDLRSGAWRLTHQGIAFDDKGNLLDGQHRLTACVQAGLPMPLLVMRGFPASVDATGSRYMDGLTNSNNVAAASNALASLATQEPRLGKLTVSQCLKVIDLWSASFHALPQVQHGPRQLRQGWINGALVFAHAAAPDLIIATRESLITGAGLRSGSHLLNLRNWILSDGPLRLKASCSGGHARMMFMNFALNLLRLHAAGLKTPSPLKPDDSADGWFYFLSPQKEKVQNLQKLLSLKSDSPPMEKPKLTQVALDLVRAKDLSDKASARAALSASAAAKNSRRAK